MSRFLSPDEYVVASLPELWFAFAVLSFATYVVLDGFDFGIGIHYAVVDESERQTLMAAFGPVWKANEVWLVLFGTVLFAGFPSVYAALLSRHYPLVFALLGALALRGVGSKLRGERDDLAWQRGCDVAFVAGSLLAPFLVGVFAASWLLGTESTIPSVLTGVAFLTLSSALGAAFVASKTDGSLQRTLRRRGGLATIATGITIATVVIVGSVTRASDVASSLESSTVAILVTGALVSVALGCIATNRPRLWFLSLAGVACTAIAFFAWSAAPAIDPTTGVEIRDAVVSPLALNLNTLFAATFVPVIVGYFVMLYSVFDGPLEEREYS